MARQFLHRFLTFVWPYISIYCFFLFATLSLAFYIPQVISPNKINNPSPKESPDCVFLTRLWMVSEHYAEAIFEMWYCPVLLPASRTVRSYCVCDCKKHLRAPTSPGNWCDLVWSGNRDRARVAWPIVTQDPCTAQSGHGNACGNLRPFSEVMEV